MSEAAAQAPHPVGRTGMLWLMVSDAFSFAALFFAFAWSRNYAVGFHDAAEPKVSAGWGAALTGVLVLSSVAMGLATRYAQREKWRLSAWATGVTAFSGALFIAMQLEEYFGLAGILFGLHREGLRLGQSAFANLFYALTAFHGLHVLSCVVLTGVASVGLLRQKFSADTLSVIGPWVQFVDGVWLFIFGAVYF